MRLFFFLEQATLFLMNLITYYCLSAFYNHKFINLCKSCNYGKSINEQFLY